MLGSVDRVLANRRLTTPVALRVGMVLICIPILLLIGVIQNALTANDDAVETVGVDATEGIAVAQQIKTNLAELDALVVRSLLYPADRADLAEQYADQRRELHDNLARAAAEGTEGAAYQLPLVNIDYALGHYHALVGDSLGALDREDPAAAIELYGQAHAVMADTVLPEADFFDKANTYLLNATYDRHRDEAETSTTGVIVAGSVLVGLLVAIQLLLVRRFRRVFNPALLAATALAIVLTGVAADRLQRSADELKTAREEAFDSVHLLARARATAVTARQAQGLWLLDPADDTAATAFDEETSKLFRLPAADAADVAVKADGQIPAVAGGYLANVLVGEMAALRLDGPAWDSLRSFGAYVQDDAALRTDVANGVQDRALATYKAGESFTSLTTAIDSAQADEQAIFDEHADAAADATRFLQGFLRLASFLIIGLTLAGLYVRLREYRD
jgi:hypothetical protein